MFETNHKPDNRKWLPHAIVAGCLSILLVVGLYPDAWINMLPSRVADRMLDPHLSEHLKAVFPNAMAFSARVARPVPHYVAYSSTETRAVAGHAFRTTELQPDERGYDGAIKMLVGLDLNGKLTGVLGAEQHEPFGYFSVGLPVFARQFKGKDIRNPFKVGADVAAVSRASISVNSAARAIRNSSHIAARALLPKPDIGN